MSVSAVKSKPVYEALRADTRGRYHVLLALEPGVAALERVLDELHRVAPQSLPQTRVLFTGATDFAERVRGRGITAVQRYPAAPPLLNDLRVLLERALMGTRLYVAGPESFIGTALKIALEFDMNKDEIRAEEVGSRARRVYCVHCRAQTENARTNIVRCGGCARWLAVRDHYSRRLAAYMGVMVDAEAPGELPPIRELYT